MSTMNISLPDALKSFVDAQVSEGGYGTSSEYVRGVDSQRFPGSARVSRAGVGVPPARTLSLRKRVNWF